MRITQLDHRPFDVPLFAPFGVATGSLDVARNVLVTVTLEDGTRGYGEAAPFPAIHGETQEHAVAAIVAAKDVVVGEDAGEWRRIAERVRGRASPLGPSPSARCAIESAVIDAFTRSHHMSMVDFFGGASRELVTDMTITTGNLKETEKAAKDVVARGIRAIKLKVGAADLDLELERVTRVRTVAPDAPLILDGNCAYDSRTALRLLELLERRKIEVALFEQPVAKDDLTGMKAITDASDVPVAADESVATPADALTVIRRGAARVINIKLMKSGIVDALDIAALARASGTGLMIGGMIETRLAMGTSACFAAGLGGFAFVDLDTPLFLKTDPFQGGYTQERDVIRLHGVTSGHGIEPDAGFFAT